MTTTYDDLRQQMIDGDDSITAAQLDKARRDSEFDHLKAEARDAAVAREVEAQRERDLVDLQAAAQDLAGRGFADMQTHYRSALDALRALRHEMAAFNREAFQIQQKAAKLGAEGIEVPTNFNVPFELDRLELLARGDHEPTPPHSRLYVTQGED